jgi:hypothetical protein
MQNNRFNAKQIIIIKAFLSTELKNSASINTNKIYHAFYQY